MQLEPVIGLETHIELGTARKLFCFCANNPFFAAPNEHVCPICMGFPGSLPVTNDEAVRRAVRFALALQFTIREESYFSRKNYFYPDLPMGYQISQYKEPIAENGSVTFLLDDGTEKTISIERLHIENDAGKLTHGAAGTLVDFNRAGVPLVEIVSRPEMHSADEAYGYARELQAVSRAVDASPADMEKGMMRFDASVSLRPRGEDKLYPRAEIKNLNSFKSLRAAIDFEIARQTKLWEDGTVPEKEMTVGWKEDKQQTVFMRWKESADDYRYFDEPDIPPILVSKTRIEEERAALPELPHQVRMRLAGDGGLQASVAATLAADRTLLALYDGTGREKTVANWLTSIVGVLNEKALSSSELKLTAESLRELHALVAAGSVSATTAKTMIVTDEVLFDGVSPAAYVAEHGLEQVQDSGAIEQACRIAIEANAKAVADYRSGKQSALMAIVGAVMRETKGKAPVDEVKTALVRLLS